MKAFSHGLKNYIAKGMLTIIQGYKAQRISPFIITLNLIKLAPLSKHKEAAGLKKKQEKD